MVLDIELII